MRTFLGWVAAGRRSMTERPGVVRQPGVALAPSVSRTRPPPCRVRKAGYAPRPDRGPIVRAGPATSTSGIDDLDARAAAFARGLVETKGWAARRVGPTLRAAS